MKLEDLVMVSPELTHAEDWREGTVIEVEQNPFVGIVITAKTESGEYFFGYESQFKSKLEFECVQ